MAFTRWLHLDWLRQHWHHGLRPHHFQTVFEFPFGSFVGEKQREMTNCMAKQSRMGMGHEIGNIELEYHGLTFSIAGDVNTHGQVDITFWNDVNPVWKAFGLWQDNIVKIGQTGENIRKVPSEYKTWLMTAQFGHNDLFITKRYFWNSWPSRISDIELNMEQNDAIEEYTVTFEYDWEYNLDEGGHYPSP